MKNIIALLAGSVFGVGLSVSGMTDRNKVLAFLDVTGQWDPTLAFVMTAALTIALPGFYLVLKRTSPVLNAHFFLPEQTGIDRALIIGAILFGIGWGAYGYCPGPALASIVYMKTESFVFVISMLVGMLIPSVVARYFRRGISHKSADVS